MLIRRDFSDTLKASYGLRIRVLITLAGMTVMLQSVEGASATTASAAPPSSRTRTSVTVDRTTGRLVRTVQVQSRVVPEKLVEPREIADTRPVPVLKPPVKIAEVVDRKAREHGVDPLLVHSVISVESAYNPYAVSPKGAEGLMQLIPSTARQFGVRNSFDVEQNIEGGVKYLKHLKTLFSDERLVLAAYNAGEGAVMKYGWVPPYAETQNYVYEVGRRYGSARRQARPADSVKTTVTAKTPEAASATTKPIEEFVDAEGRVHLVIRE